ncbi:hypothetical protein ANCCAN_04592 [Ancylostoma caninum]|uniref:VWFA domain-containing protein n=1 Tax=Ancylostoma caninum TaxID=29170 RepID=A0A368GY97_ANCCA|nr:hypothetical protein ANCCAN_04592 [Ancylostoma caninum]
MSTAAATTTGTLLPTTSTQTPTTTADLLKDSVHCLFVADLYSYGHNEKLYEQEKRFIREVSSLFFQRTDVSTAGIAAYGYVPELPINLDPALNKMAISHRGFAKNVQIDTELRSDRLHSITSDALCALKKFKDLKGRANCLVFFSADKSIASPQKINSKYLKLGHEWERVVAVGFNDTDLSNLVESPQGTSLMVPHHYEEKHVRLVVDDILAAF